MSSNEGETGDVNEEKIAMELSHYASQLPPSASTCRTCHKLASIRSFQYYPHVQFVCACGANNFPDSVQGKNHLGEGSAALESEQLKTSIDEGGSKLTVDWTCKTCHTLACFRSSRFHPHLLFICVCGQNNFDGSAGQHHSGEGCAVLESEKPTKTSIDEERSKPTADACKTCHTLASFKSLQSHPLHFKCACGENNFDGSAAQDQSGEGVAVLESANPLQKSIEEEGSKTTTDWPTCKTCHTLAFFKSFQTHPPLRFICDGGNIDFDHGSGVQNHSGEGGAVLGSEFKPLKTSIDEEGPKPTIDWICKTCHTLASFKRFKSQPSLCFLCACGANNFDGSGGQHRSGEGGAVLKSKKLPKTSIVEKGKRQPESQGSSTSSTTKILCLGTEGGPGGSWGRRAIDEKGYCRPATQGSSTSSIKKISDSETEAGPGSRRWARRAWR